MKNLTFPNKLKFMNSNSDENNMNNISKYKLKDLCDSRVYLSSLIIVANALNDSFQESMRQMILRSGDIGQDCHYRAEQIKKYHEHKRKLNQIMDQNHFQLVHK